MDCKQIGGKGEEKLDRLWKATVLNSTKAAASGFSAPSFIKQVLLPLFPHSSWGESSWPCSISYEVSEPSLCSRERDECLHARWPAAPRKYLKYRSWAIIIWSGGLFSRAAFFPLGAWWHLLGGHRETKPNSASKKGSCSFGGGRQSPVKPGEPCFPSCNDANHPENNAKDKLGKYIIFLIMQ